MSTNVDCPAAQLEITLNQETGAGQAGQDPDGKQLTCSPWLGLHYRAEQG